MGRVIPKTLLQRIIKAVFAFLMATVLSKKKGDQ